MRITLGGVAATVLLLFFLGVYRPTRSSFSGWWSFALLCAGLSTSLLLFNGTPAQVFTTPASNMLSAIGVTGTWFAMRSLRHRRLPRWLLVVSPAAILLLTFTQDPATNIWAGNGPMFAYMGVLFAAGAIEMWLAWRVRRAVANDELDGQAAVAFLVSAIAASVIALFYCVRSILYFAVGPLSDLFQAVAGTSATTGALLICMVAVTFSVSAVGWDQQTQELRRRAAHDDLTGLLGRNEFRAQATSALNGMRLDRSQLMLVMIDLDHFKQINDNHGHLAGDRTLRAFGATLKESLEPGEIAGRLGGEEFGLVLVSDSEDAVMTRLASISENFNARASQYTFAFPTASFGATAHQDGDSIAQMSSRADFALYLAKEQGRNRGVFFDEGVGHGTQLAERRQVRDTIRRLP